MTLFDVPKNLDALVLRANASLDLLDTAVVEAVRLLKATNDELEELRALKKRVLAVLGEPHA